MTSERAVKVLYFAAATTVTGISSETIPLPSSPDPFRLSSLGPLLVSKYPHTSLDKVLEGSSTLR